MISYLQVAIHILSSTVFYETIKIANNNLRKCTEQFHVRMNERHLSHSILRMYLKCSILQI